MKISIFGLGYVGVVSAGCLTRDGFEVIGVDVNPDKVELVQTGKAPIIELGLSELLQAGVKNGRLTATTSATDAIAQSDVSVISVGTPSNEDGSPNLTYVFGVCEQIGQAIKAKGQEHTVIIRSTIFPGTTQKCINILNNEAGDIPVHVAFNPEFLREGSAIRDYDAPAYTIAGTHDAKAEEALREMFAAVDAPLLTTKPEVAELIKCTANAWHAAKIVFANEIGRIAKSADVDGREVMDILTQDTKLNISKAYMRPGFAFGGSCLPKDVRTLLHYASSNNIELPLLDALHTSNDSHITLALEQVRALGKKKVGLLGLAFKSGTDDLRESPAVTLASQLLEEGFELTIFDECVQDAWLIGANREYIESKIPHLTNLLVEDAKTVLEKAEALVITHGAAAFRTLVEQAAPETPVLDLAGLFSTPPEGKAYNGIAW